MFLPCKFHVKMGWSLWPVGVPSNGARKSDVAHSYSNKSTEPCGGRLGGVNEQPRQAVKGLPCVGWYGVWWDSRWVGVLGPSKYGLLPRVPDQKESELIVMLSFLALSDRWP